MYHDILSSYHDLRPRRMRCLIAHSAATSWSLSMHLPNQALDWRGLGREKGEQKYWFFLLREVCRRMTAKDSFLLDVKWRFCFVQICSFRMTINPYLSIGLSEIYRLSRDFYTPLYHINSKSSTRSHLTCRIRQRQKRCKLTERYPGEKELWW